MPKFNNSKDLDRYLRKAADTLMAEIIITTQARLGSKAVSPIDSGRLRSSWFASEGSPSDAVPPEDANSPNTDAAELRVDSRKDYYLTSNLPYTQRVALEGHVVSKPANWFIDLVNHDIPKIADTAARVVQRDFGLNP